jgi:integrase
MVAKKILERREGDIAQGKVPGIQFDKVTFDELAEEFLRDYRINQKKSLPRAEICIKQLNKGFAGSRITEITTPRIQEYVSERMKWSCKKCQTNFHPTGGLKCPRCGETKLIKGASNATINREVAALKRVLNLGARQTPPKVNRVPYIPMLKENNARKGFFEHKDFLALLDALPEYLKPMVLFGYKVGWRDQEISSLTWDAVDLDNGIVTLRVGETKNDEGRTVYLDDELKPLFRELWEKRKHIQHPTKYVFSNNTGSGPIISFRRSWNSACRKTQLGYGYKINQDYVNEWQSKLQAGPIFHDFRRTAVRNMIRSGIPERVAMMISGHKTRSVFDRYNIVSDTDLRQAAQKHQDYLVSQMGTILGTI